MNKINFSFKSITPNSMPRPYVLVKFKNEKKEDKFPCLIDSGADFTTIPIQNGKFMLGINFKERIAPPEIIYKWQNLNQSNLKEMKKFIYEIAEEKFAVPINIGCACGKGTSGYLYCVETEIGKMKRNIPVLWINSEGVSPLLGRFGLFDKAEEVLFNAKSGKGHILM